VSYEKIEAIVPAEDAPKPHQVRAIASIGIKMANEQNRLLANMRFKRTHFWRNQMNGNVEGDVLFDESLEVQRTVAGIIKRHIKMVPDPETQVENDIGLREWSMRLYDSYFLRPDPESAVRVGTKAMYRFEWDKEHVTLATRFVRMEPSLERKEIYDLGDEILHFSMPDDEVPIWHARMEFERVTEADCELLLSDIQQYHDYVRSQYEL